MANAEQGTDFSEDINLDESLGDFEMDDDDLFADLDAEIKLDDEGGGESIVADDADLNLDDMDLGDIPLEEAPAAEASDGGDLDDLDLDDLSLDVEEAPAAEASGGGDLDDLELSLDEEGGDGLDDLIPEEEAALDLEAEIELEADGEDAELELDVGDTAEPEDGGVMADGDLELSEEIELDVGDDLDLEEGTELSLDDADLVEEPTEAEAASEFQAAPDVDLDDLDLSEELSSVAAQAEMPHVGGIDTVGAAFDEAIEVNFDEMESDMDMGSEYTAISNVDVGEDEVLELDVDELDAYSHAPPAPVESAAGKATGMIGSDVLLGIPHQLSVEVGSVSLSGRDILDLSYGSVISLERNVGEPVDLVLEGRRIAQGEIVLINGNHLGVRIVALEK